MQPTTFENEIAGAVLRHFIDTGNAIDAPGIAALVGRSASMVRTYLRGAVPGVEATRGERVRYSKSYRSMQVGVSRVWMYEPTKSALRESLLAACAGVNALAVQIAKAREV